MKRWMIGLIMLSLVASACGDGASPQTAKREKSAVATSETGPSRAEKDVLEIDVGEAPSGIATGFDSVWMGDHHDDVLYRIDPESNEVTAKIHVSELASNVDIGFGAVWLMANQDDTVWRIDPSSNRAKRIFAGPKKGCVETGCDLSVGEGGVWVRDSVAVRKLAPESGKEIGKVAGVSGNEVMGLEASSGAVWTQSHAGAIRINPTSLDVEATVAFQPSKESFGCAGDRGFVWCLAGRGKVVEIDAATNKVVNAYRAGVSGSGENAIALTRGAVWVFDGDHGGVTRVRMDNGSVSHKPGLTYGIFWSLAVGYGSVWATDYSGQLLKIDMESL